ncbi:hypothetical protein D3C86_443440 [compost metagenome]
MGFDEVLGDGQAQSKPARLMVAFSLPVRGEDLRVMLGRDADARIPNFHAQRPRLSPGTDLDRSTGWGKPERVGEQVYQDLAQPDRIPPDGDEIRGDGVYQPNGGLIGKWTQHEERFFHELGG